MRKLKIIYFLNEYNHKASNSTQYSNSIGVQFPSFPSLILFVLLVKIIIHIY